MIGDAGLEMHARFEVAGEHLVLDYEVRNGTPRDVYLLNRLYRTTPTWQIGPDIVYVEFVPGTKTVRLFKKLADLPKGVNVTAPVAPFVTPLRAGGTFHETVRIPLSVREYLEYSMRGPRPAGEPQTAVYQNVSFTLGYYWRVEGTREETRQIRGTEVVMPIGPRDKRPEFGLLESGPVRLEVSVVLPPAEPGHQ
jgi:hypothetical protein